ncbi:MAG TPA: class I SAM-dependent methyltransferase, partial [Thermoanaerobaculia bacterium]
MADVAAAPVQSGDTGWISRLLSRVSFPCSFRVHVPGGEMIDIGEAAPEFDVIIRNERGMRALQSTEELRIADAYVRGDLELEGDVIKAMWLRNSLSDRNLWLKIWRRLQPMIFGREKLNPDWIAKHYDSNNVQLMALDRDYYAYTPGIYLNDEETLEQSSQRKYEFAWDSLGLKPGQELLEIGCGWGGMTRFCASRGVRVTGITLSKHQHAHVNRLIDERGLGGRVAMHLMDYRELAEDQPFQKIASIGMFEHVGRARLPTYFR